ncbi:formate dehydrogenase accessory sulfurtransferase FdhD [Candidatus Desulforudis audaxviator]|uniref:formate dehydrogenase accessory sulfurtransferase FdhD n=1 Tax=Candidatus Desulforudis audaxviator TaxID=471827 RepID=UPI00107BCA93|nr:formate dehydrogenase accessory sulfurtransferase FdhD [Candidatus Desulforudis audaxviator]AZK60570.1 Formate dehydrogenase assembly factor FdhD [Candidatus Desulforudis audaxviator]
MSRVPMTLTNLRPMHRFSSLENVHGWDEIVTEKEFAIHIDGHEFTRLLCLPADLEYLAAGHLALAGRLTDPGEVDRIEVDFSERVVRVYTKASDKPAPAAQTGRLEMTPEQVREFTKHLPAMSALFQRTGGVHSGGLVGEGNLLFTMEDTGRHNVMDKIYGRSFLEGIPLGDKALLFSGRSTAEVLMKLERMGIPMIIARGAPTTMAIDLAERAGITLAAYARPDRFSVFTHPGRIIGPLADPEPGLR